MKRALNIMLWCLLLGGVLVLPAFSHRQIQEEKCSALSFRIQPSESVMLLTEQDLQEYVSAAYDSIQGMPVKDFHPGHLEAFLEAHPYVRSAEAYIDLQRRVCVDISQEEPLLRLSPEDGPARYISHTGRIMPLRAGMPSRVPVVNGFVSYGLTSGDRITDEGLPTLHELYGLAMHIEADTFLSRLIDQYYVNARGEISLVPRLGRCTIQLGRPEGFETKLENLKAFYQGGFSQRPWEMYKTINLRYNNQVVCTKR